jgi:uncharacterized protein (DUF4415 family)
MIPTLEVMAQKTTVVLVDDLNGKPAETTLRFSLDAREYELDLTEENAQELRELFGRYIPVARRVSGRRATSTPAKPATSTRSAKSVAPAKAAFAGVDPAAVRAWAKGNGVKVSPRGRIKADVIEAFRAAGH